MSTIYFQSNTSIPIFKFFIIKSSIDPSLIILCGDFNIPYDTGNLPATSIHLIDIFLLFFGIFFY